MSDDHKVLVCSTHAGKFVVPLGQVEHIVPINRASYFPTLNGRIVGTIKRDSALAPIFDGSALIFDRPGPCGEYGLVVNYVSKNSQMHMGVVAVTTIPDNEDASNINALHLGNSKDARLGKVHYGDEELPLINLKQILIEQSSKETEKHGAGKT